MISILKFCIVNLDLFYILGFELVHVFVMLSHQMPFYGAFVEEVL